MKSIRRSTVVRTVRLTLPVLVLLMAATGVHAQGVSFFIEQARSGTPEERAEAYEELAALRGPEVEAALAAGIADPSPDVRRAAAGAAIGHSSDIVTEALVKAFHDQSLDVQHTAISVFIMNGKPLKSGYRPLLSLLEAPNPQTRAYAAWAVGTYRNPGALDRLRKLFDGGDELQRANVCWAVGEIGSAEGLDLLLRALGDERSSVREKAAVAAAKIGDPSAVPRLRALLKNESDAGARKAAEQALAALEEAPATE